MPTQNAPARNQAERFFSSGSTPPVGINFIFGKIGKTDETKPGPSTDPGKTLIISAPLSEAITISVMVAQPGIHKIAFAFVISANSFLKIGETMKCAPALMYCLAE